MNRLSQQDIERRSRELFEDSVGGLDMRIRSRLTQARHAALAAVERGSRPRARWMARAPAYAAAAAVVLGVALWMNHPVSDRFFAPTDARSGLEDLELVASNEPLELLQEDIDFYDWIDRSAAADSTGEG